MKTTHRIAIISSLILFFSRAYPVVLVMQPTAPSVITRPTLANFDLFATGLGPTMFVIHLNNAGNPVTHKNLRLRYYVYLERTSHPEKGKQVVYIGLSNTFDVEADTNISIKSNDFLVDRNPDPMVRASLHYTEYELTDTELKNLLLTSGRIPDGRLSFALKLLPDGVSVSDSAYSEHTILNATSVTLVSPGLDPSGVPMSVATRYPDFVWVSNLTPYPSGDAFEIRIYEADEGETMGQALSKLPIHRAQVNTYAYKYPTGGRELVAGHTYYWQVTGLLRSTEGRTTPVQSNILAFSVYKPPNPKVLEVISILRPVVGETVIEQVSDYSSDVMIRIDGREYGVAELRELIIKVHTGEYTLKPPSVY
jgi:hypothetical protein